MAIIDIQVYGAKAVANKLGKIPAKLASLEKTFWNRKMSTYKIFAKWIILNVVYGAYSPKVYQRTMKLRRSIKTKKISGGMRLYQDSKVTKPKLDSSRYPSYAHYFIYGGGFLAMKNTVPIRDFLGAWDRFFNRKFRQDYNREVVRPAVGI